MSEQPNGTTSRLRLSKVAALGKLVLRGKPEIVGAAANDVGFDLPEAINHAADGAAGRAIRLGPDEFLLLPDAGRASELARSLGEALQDRHHAMVDVSARLVAVELIGSSVNPNTVRDTLATACPLDLNPSTFGSGQATRTVFGKAEIILDCLGPDHFRILTNRSFADYVGRLLHEAGREFGLTSTPEAEAFSLTD